VKGSNPHEERERQVAREIQSGLLPAHPLVAGPWEVHGTLVPIPSVGGAFLDHGHAGPHRFVLALGEASGRGVRAALRLAHTQTTLRVLCNSGLDLAERISLLNRHLIKSEETGHFVTLFHAEIDHAREVLSYVNAGHPFPLLRHADARVEWLKQSQLPLGVLEEVRFEETCVPLLSGDTLLVYSEAVFGAENAAGIQFGDERLREFWKAHGARSAHEVLPDLVRAVSEFRGGAPQQWGDIAALVVTSREA